MPISVYVTRDYDQVSETAFELFAQDIKKQLAAKAEYILGLATGISPVGFYKHLAMAANAGKIEAGRIRSFNLDEYVGLPGEQALMRAMHPESYANFMTTELFGLLRTKFRETNIPAGTLIDQKELQIEMNAHPEDWREVGGDSGRAIAIKPKAESPYLAWIRKNVLEAYAKKIRTAGGVDLQIIGVGGRGHVAFHEAGIPFNAGAVLLVKLDDNTVANAVADGHFATIKDSPRFAVTMGASLVFQARRIFLLANGARKKDPVYRSLLEAPSSEIPISYGQEYAAQGGHLIYIVDEVAGEGLLANRRQLKARGITLIDRRNRPVKRKVADICFYRDLQLGGWNCR